MANIAHSVLAGTEIHEPKGVAAAALGQVYVADGNGSGNWAGVGTSSFTGMIADFTWPVVQDGWLELDGSDVSTTTYGALYDVMTIQMTGTRVSATNTITSLSSTSNMRVGYYVFGTGIPSGTTVTTINSGTQITLSTNASSSGTTTVVVSPWLLNTGTIRLPDLSTAGRFRRSRTASTAVGQLQASQNLYHGHTFAAQTGYESSTHTHGFSGTSGFENQSLNHSHNLTAAVIVGNGQSGGEPGRLPASSNITSSGINSSISHTHNFSGNTGGQSQNHYHNLSGTTTSTGDDEARPQSIVVMTCVKT